MNFSLLALDQIVNTAAALRHMSGGQFSVPLVVRMATGAGRQLAAQHSHSLENWYAPFPASPCWPRHGGRRLRDAAHRADQPDPVIIFEHVGLYNNAAELEALQPTDINRAALRRNGKDATIIAYGGNVPKALDAAEQLAQAGIDCEVVDLRVLRPLDDATIMASVARTHRVVVVDEAWHTGSLAGRSAPASSNRLSTNWTRRSDGSAPWRCRFLTPNTLSRLHFRSPIESWQRSGPCSGESDRRAGAERPGLIQHDRIHDARLGR